MSIYQVVIKGSDSASQLRNVMHFEFPGYIPTTPELQEFVDGVAATYDTYILPYTHAAVEYSSIEVRRVDVADLPSIDLTPTSWPASGGSGTSEQMPAQVAALASWKAPTAYPRSTRTYLFPFSVQQATPTGRVEPAAVTGITNFTLEMEEIPVTGQVDAQKVAVQYSGTPRTVTASNLVYSTTQSDVFGTQRSRRIGKGI